MTFGRREKDFETGINMLLQNLSDDIFFLKTKKHPIIKAGVKLTIFFDATFMLFLFFFGKVKNVGNIHIFTYITHNRG